MEGAVGPNLAVYYKPSGRLQGKLQVIPKGRGMPGMPRPNGNVHGSDCHGSVSANFVIEWDESILAGGKAPIQIGSVLQTDGIPKMLPNGTWVPTSNLRVSISTVGPTDEEVYHRLPKRYHQSLLSSLIDQTAAELQLEPYQVPTPTVSEPTPAPEPVAEQILANS